MRVRARVRNQQAEASLPLAQFSLCTHLVGGWGRLGLGARLRLRLRVDPSRRLGLALLLQLP